MAKKKKGQLAFRLGINDERIPKLLGILCLFIAFYLFVAFTSYLFTWGYDQDKLDIFFTELLSSDIVEIFVVQLQGIGKVVAFAVLLSQDRTGIGQKKTKGQNGKEAFHEFSFEDKTTQKI